MAETGYLAYRIKNKNNIEHISSLSQDTLRNLIIKIEGKKDVDQKLKRLIKLLPTIDKYWSTSDVIFDIPPYTQYQRRGYLSRLMCRIHISSISRCKGISQNNYRTVANDNVFLKTNRPIVSDFGSSTRIFNIILNLSSTRWRPNK